MTDLPKQAAEYIRSKAPDFTPQISIILGSGLGGLADAITSPVKIDYAEIPGFSTGTVKGHNSCMILGYLEDIPVVCLQGRIHLYEGIEVEYIKNMIRSLKCLGCETLLISNAAGGLHASIQPGNLMLITDHINFQGINPLQGPNQDEYGPRFLAMENAYDNELKQKFLATAEDLKINLEQGVYLAVQGPSFETRAEIQAFRTLGADAVGMSTVAEVIVAHHCGLKVAAISVITNLATGMTSEKISHADTLRIADLASADLQRLLKGFLRNNHAS